MVGAFNAFASSGAGTEPGLVPQPSRSEADMHRAGWQLASILKTKMELKAAFPLLPEETGEACR